MKRLIMGWNKGVGLMFLLEELTYLSLNKHIKEQM